MSMMKRCLFLLLLSLPLVALTACETPQWGGVPTVPITATNPQAPETATASATVTAAVPPTEVTVSSQPPTPTLSPDSWKSMPIVPVVSQRMIEVYRAGVAAGRNSARFSKVGDCQNITTYFLASFDSPNDYRLGSTYAYLQLTIDHFADSWSRQSLAVKGGMNVAAVQNPMWANHDMCNSGETPIACEIRKNNPSIVLISLEESWSGDIDKYDRYMRTIVEYVLSQDVVPILATRAEGPDPKISINTTVAQIAYDYDVPLWNFWAAAYPLPSHGLTADGFHLTWAAPFFDDPLRMKMGWPWRNLTALQVMETVWHVMAEGQ